MSYVKTTIGPDIDLLVDCHCRFDLALARRAADKVRHLNLFWFEEPIQRDQVDALAAFTSSAGLTTAGAHVAVAVALSINRLNVSIHKVCTTSEGESDSTC